MAAKLQHTEATRRRLLTDLAHELRTPIATIDGYLEAIQDGVERADPETIELLRRQVRRRTRLADDVRAVSAADESRPDLHADAEELAQELQQRGDISVIANPEGGVWIFRGR